VRWIEVMNREGDWEEEDEDALQIERDDGGGSWREEGYGGIG
jgi:hypothetical protein